MSASKIGSGNENFDRLLERLGYAYDQSQGIFVSILHAWQRDFGYCRLYDEAAALFSMIIDCEPIYFSYGGKRWLIELWKGQYALTTGAEIGVYWTDLPDIEVPGVFQGPFFFAAGDADLLPLSFTLSKEGKTLFSREQKHWWLTGFMLGEFSEPDQLAMEAAITLKDEAMLYAFLKGLKWAGYREHEWTVRGTTVSLQFTAPRTPQPSTRNPATDWLVQRKNEMLCGIYRELTGRYGNIWDKFRELQKRAPALYGEAMKIGKTAPLYESYALLQPHLA